MNLNHNIMVGDIVSARFDDYTLVKKGEVLRLPVWENDLWIIKDLSTRENFQLSNVRAKITKII